MLRLLDSGKAVCAGTRPAGHEDRPRRIPGDAEATDGMILVAGPTGSGKSTTLASSIMTLDRTGLNVITMEDPVENELPNVNQLQVHVEAGVTFASLLRSILRLDPGCGPCW